MEAATGLNYIGQHRGFAEWAMEMFGIRALLSGAGAVCLSLAVGAVGPVHGQVARDATVDFAVTPGAFQALDEGDLDVASVQPATEADPQTFEIPLKSVTLGATGKPRRVRFTGGIQIQGENSTLQLTNLSINLPKKQASVWISSPDARIQAFDVSRIKATKRTLSGVLLIAPGTAAVLNAEFDTYVFSDGLRFARFSVDL
jgi:hypothetical protein